MKHSHSLQHLQKFVYIDSSEEEGEVEKKQSQAVVERQCTGLAWKQDAYKREMKQLVQNEIDRIEGGNVLLVGADDKQVESNFRMRQQKLEYFKKQMQIDEKYNRMMEEKASKLRQENRRKQEVLVRKRQQEQMRQEECMLKKYTIDKRTKQQVVVDKVKKTAHKLAVERKAHTANHIRSQLQQQRQLTHQQVEGLRVKQKNQLDQLRQKLELLKEEKRINRLDQQKVLRDLEQQNLKQKQQLKGQLLIKQFKV